MKTAILTFHNTRNCGAALQAYALQKAINDMGVDCKILDYRCDAIVSAYRLVPFWKCRGVKALLKWCLTAKRDRVTQKKFDRFSQRYFRCSDVYKKDTVRQANTHFDAFVVGSDQVWNMHLNGQDQTYLLDFADDSVCKIAYAASMGYRTVPDEIKDAFTTCLDRFDAVSVREIPAQDSLEELSGKKPELVLDPTLLLEKADYDVFTASNVPKKPYIFVYTIADTPHIAHAAKKLSKHTGLPVVWGHMSHYRKSGAKNVTTLCPEEFIDYIRNATYVLTSSFHGMALSVVLEKQFFYDLDARPQNNNSRLETLAALLKLEDRLLLGEDDLAEKARINYDSVNELKACIKAESLAFLERNLKR